MTEDKLDALLRTPLPPLDDSGFTTSVMVRMAPATHPLAALEIALLAISAVLALMFLPVRAVTEVAVHVSSQLANSTGAAMACLAIVVTLYFLRDLETY